MGIFFPNPSTEDLIGFADAGYMSDPHNARSQTGYVFTCGGTAISWRSMKQTISATSSNHAEILAIHEASRECVWLRSVIQHIREDCGLSTGKESPTDGYMLHVSLNSKMDTSKETEQSAFYRNYFSPMIYRRMAMFVSFKFVQVTI